MQGSTARAFHAAQSTCIPCKYTGRCARRGLEAALKALRIVWFAATLLVLGYGLRVALFLVPADAAQGDMGRIFYYHLPAWIGTSLFFALNLICSVSYLLLRQRNASLALRADTLAVASAEMGLVFCTVGLVTGSLWGRAAWGIWWTWDERLTSTLMLWLIYLAYMVLRSFSDSGSRRTLAAVMAIFGYLDVPLVYMSTRWWRTQHPGPVFFGGPNAGVDPSMMPALWWNIAGWVMWGLLVASLRYSRLLAREQALEAETIALLAPPRPMPGTPGLPEGDRA